MSKGLLPTRRQAIAALGAGALATPWIWRRPADAAPGGQIVVRTTGGAYDEIMRRAVYDPFRAATGIEVVTAPATMTKLLAMYRAGSVELDVIDTGDSGLLNLERIGALVPLQYDAWKFAKPDDIIKELRFPYRVANFVYATVMAYSTETFAQRHPQGWAEFWDLGTFPGARTLPDMAVGQPPLEFSLIADGMPMDKLYPIDIPRALRSLTRIKGSIPKFWDTGALSAQMLSDKEVVLAGLWNGRVQTVIDKGAKLAVEWNQNMIQVQGYGIPKGAKNPEGAQLFVDFASQPGPQAAYARELHYGPSNARGYDLLPKELLDGLPGGPRYRELGFYQDIAWWEDNRDRVNRAWSNWVLG